MPDWTAPASATAAAAAAAAGPSTSYTLQPPSSAAAAGASHRVVSSAMAPAPTRPARPRAIPIYVRIVPNDQWLRIHVSMSASMGAIKDDILTRAKFPRTRPAVLDHLPKAIVAYAPSKDIRTLTGLSSASATNLPPGSAPVKLSATSKAAKLLSRSHSSAHQYHQAAQQQYPTQRRATAQHLSHSQEVEQPIQHHNTPRSPPRQTASLKDLYGHQSRQAEAPPSLPSSQSQVGAPAQQAPGLLQPPQITNDLHSDSEARPRTSMSDSVASFVSVDEQLGPASAAPAPGLRATPDASFSAATTAPANAPTPIGLMASPILTKERPSSQPPRSVEKPLDPANGLLNSPPATTSSVQISQSPRSAARLSARQLSSITALPAVTPGSPPERKASLIASTAAMLNPQPTSPTSPNAGSFQASPVSATAPSLHGTHHELSPGSITSSNGLPNIAVSHNDLAKAGWTTSADPSSPIRTASSTLGSSDGQALGDASSVSGRISESSSTQLGFSSSATPASASGGRGNGTLLGTEQGGSSRPRSRTITAGDAAVRAFGAILSRARGKSRTKDKDKDERDKRRDKESERERKKSLKAFAIAQTRSDSGVRASSHFESGAVSAAVAAKNSSSPYLPGTEFVGAGQHVASSGAGAGPPQASAGTGRTLGPPEQQASSPRQHLSALPPSSAAALAIAARRSTSSPYPPRAPSTGAAAAAAAAVGPSYDGGIGGTGTGAGSTSTTGRNSVSNSIGSTGDHSANTSASGAGSGTAPEGAGTGTSAGTSAGGGGGGGGSSSGYTGFGISGWRKRRGSLATATSVSAGTGSGAGANPGGGAPLGGAFESRRGSEHSSIGSVQRPPAYFLQSDHEGGASTGAGAGGLEAPSMAASHSNLAMSSSLLAPTTESEGDSPYLGVRQALLGGAAGGSVPRQRRASASAGEVSSSHLPVVARPARNTMLGLSGSTPGGGSAASSAIVDVGHGTGEGGSHSLGLMAVDEAATTTMTNRSSRTTVVDEGGGAGSSPVAATLSPPPPPSAGANSTPALTPASVRAADNTITVSVPESSARLQQELGTTSASASPAPTSAPANAAAIANASTTTAPNFLTSLAGLRLGGIATDKISTFDSALAHPLSKAFGLYSYAAAGVALEDWKTVASCGLRPWELLELQWCNDGVGIGIGESAAFARGAGAVGGGGGGAGGETVSSSGTLVGGGSGGGGVVVSAASTTGLMSGPDSALEGGDVSYASTTITRDTGSVATLASTNDKDDSLGPLRGAAEARSLHPKRSVLDSPSKRPVTAPQGGGSAAGAAQAGGGRLFQGGATVGIGVTGAGIPNQAEEAVERTSTDSTSALNFSSGATEAIRSGSVAGYTSGMDGAQSGSLIPAVPMPFDGPPLGLGAGRVCLPRETWGPGTSSGPRGAIAGAGAIKTIPFDSTYAQPFFETWVYVYKPSAKALSKTQKVQGLGVWKRRWLVICGWRMGLLRKKEGRNLLLGRWLAASSQAASSALAAAGGPGGEEGVGTGVGIMTTAGIDTEQGITGDGEYGGSNAGGGGGGKGQDASSVPAATPGDASAPASVPTYFLDALRAITVDTSTAPTMMISPTAKFEENLPMDRISLAFQPGGSRDPKGFGALIDPSILSNDPASALQSLTQSSSFTSNIGSALASGGGLSSGGRTTAENGIMLLHLRCISAHDHTTLLQVLRRAQANKPGASLGGGLFSPSAAAMAAGGATGVGFASGMTGLGVGVWRRSAIIRATIAGRGGTVQPGKAGRRHGRNAFSRMRTRPSGMPTVLDNADEWSSGSEEEGPTGEGMRLKQAGASGSASASLGHGGPIYSYGGSHSQAALSSGALVSAGTLANTSQIPYSTSSSSSTATGFNSSLRSAVSGGASKLLRKRPSTSGSFAGSMSGAPAFGATAAEGLSTGAGAGAATSSFGQGFSIGATVGAPAGTNPISAGGGGGGGFGSTASATRWHDRMTSHTTNNSATASPRSVSGASVGGGGGAGVGAQPLTSTPSSTGTGRPRTPGLDLPSSPSFPPSASRS